eukprot:1256039-Rhodomonas_salina.1
MIRNRCRHAADCKPASKLMQCRRNSRNLRTAAFAPQTGISTPARGSKLWPFLAKPSSFSCVPIPSEFPSLGTLGMQPRYPRYEGT